MESRTTQFPGVRFTAPTVEAGIAALRLIASDNPQSTHYQDGDGGYIEVDLSTALEFSEMKVRSGRTTREFDDFELLLAEIRTGAYDSAEFVIGMTDQVYYSERTMMWVKLLSDESTVKITHNLRQGIERVFGIFIDSSENQNATAPGRPTIFIGHGGASQEWRDVRDYLRNTFDLRTEDFSAHVRAGHTVTDVLNSMLSSSGFALLVYSAEDQQHDGSLRARQNVVHETGFFQARLGNAKTIILKETVVEPPSNLDGVQYIPYETGRISQTFGELVGAIRREFPGI